MPYYSHIIWDFNGTLLNDVDAGIRSINTLLARRKMPLISSAEEYRTLFRFPIIAYYRMLGFDFDKEPYAKLAVEWVEEYNKEVCKAALQPGARELLTFVREHGYKQVLLSATESSMLRTQTETLGIASAFDEMIGLDNIHAAGKIAVALAWKERENPQRMLMIGDTDHDAETAQALGADCVLVSVGHQSLARLRACGVDTVSSIGALYSYIR